MTAPASAHSAHPSVTVVVLNWNGAALIPDCLGSLAALDYPSDRLEVVVVDNASTDGSRHLVRARFPHVRLVENAENLGFAAANNAAARAATTPYVAFLNNDARVDRRWLLELIDHLEASPQLAAAGSMVLDWSGEHIDFAGGAMSLLGRGHQPGHGKPVAAAPDGPRPVLFANGAAMAVRRDAFLDAGGFDARFFAYYEDVDLGWRLWVLGWEVALVPASITYHRHHGTSRTVAPEKIELLLTRNAVLMLVKNFGQAWLDRVLPVALLGIGAEIERELGLDPRAMRISAADAFARRTNARRPRPSIRRLARRMRDAVAGRGPAAIGRVVVSLTGARRRSAALRATAMADVLAAWPELMAERNAIQERRRRTDAEIVPLFRLADVPAEASPVLAAALAVASSAETEA